MTSYRNGDENAQLRDRVQEVERTLATFGKRLDREGRELAMFHARGRTVYIYDISDGALRFMMLCVGGFLAVTVLGFLVVGAAVALSEDTFWSALWPALRRFGIFEGFALVVLFLLVLTSLAFGLERRKVS